MILPWIVGQKNAREMLLAGSRKISARRAERMGLVNQVVAGEDLMAAATSMAESIAANDPGAVRLTRRALNLGLEAAGLRRALKDALEIDIEIESREKR
jgi:enoyl-CoA hydratase/carnithine racemase